MGNKGVRCFGAGMLLTLCIVARVGAGEPISGSARAVKGDTVILKGARVRLYGVESPAPDEQCPGADRAWSCGAQSRAALARLVEGLQLQCEVQRKVGHGKWQATCLADGRDIALEQLAHGWVRALPEASEAYQQAATAAREAGIGLWRSD